MKTIRTIVRAIAFLSFIGIMGVGYAFFSGMLPVKEVQAVQVAVEIPTVDIIKHLNPKVDPQVAQQIAGAIDQSAEKYNLPKNLVACVAYRESGFATLASSNKDCIGIMQVNPAVHMDKIRKRRLNADEVYHISPNVDLGCEILAENLVYTHGDLGGALQRYVGRAHPTYVGDVFAALGRVTAEIK